MSAWAACRRRSRRPSFRRLPVKFPGHMRRQYPRGPTEIRHESAVCMRVAPNAKDPSRRCMRDGSHRILADRADVRDDHDADDETGAEHVESWQLRPQLLQGWRHEQQGKIAVHDGRNGAQQLQRGLDDLSNAARSHIHSDRSPSDCPSAPRQRARRPWSRGCRRPTGKCRSAAPRRGESTADRR